jgi:hypothetical protein
MTILDDLIVSKTFKYKDLEFRILTIGDDLKLGRPFKEQLLEGSIDGKKYVEGSLDFVNKMIFYTLYIGWVNNTDQISFKEFEEKLLKLPIYALENLQALSAKIVSEGVYSEVKLVDKEEDNQESVKKKKKKRLSRLLIVIFCLVGLALLLRWTTS